MLKVTTADRLKTLMSERNLKQIDIINLAKPYCKKHEVKLGRNDLSQYISGKCEPRQNKLYVLSKALKVNPAWLMGYDVPIEPDGFSNVEKRNTDKFPSPNLTDDYVTFPVIGEIAAGYDDIAIENWDGEIIEIPLSYLRGRTKDEYFVLRVKGDSMYPLYHENDKVLILKQTTLNNSGDIGAVIYDDEIATLKKIEYINGENWIRLIPINPNIPPMQIEGEHLEHFRILGIPKLIIREV